MTRMTTTTPDAARPANLRPHRPAPGAPLRGVVFSLVGGILACLVVCAPAAAKKPPARWAVIAGTLFSPDATLVRGAPVEVRQVNGKKHWITTTDDAGEFDLPVPAGRADYEIHAKIRGFQPLTAKVHVEADEKVTIFLHLQK
ncbi:MAG: carboxypeptidase-like regulatory domain-containing protein [Terriglobales bacterium]